MRKLALLLLGVAACAVPGPLAGPRTLEEAAQESADAPRRASIHLVRRAFATLDQGSPSGARALADQALRVDGSNPYAFLVLAEIELAEGDPQAALLGAERARLLLEAAEPENTRWLARCDELRERASRRLSGGQIGPVPESPR